MVGVEHGALINVKWRDGEIVNETVYLFFRALHSLW